MPAIPAGGAGRGSRSPPRLIWGRHDLATPLEVAEAASARHGWPLHVIEDCADDPPVEQPEAFLAALRTAARGRGSRCRVDTLRRRLRGAAAAARRRRASRTATRLWNGMISKTPALVVQPSGTADVVAAVGFARDHGLALGVRGGGHNIAGTALADGGLTIDMSRLRGVARRPRGADRHGAARLPARRRRPRDAAPRAGDAARLHLRGRRRRPDARRRPRLPDPPLRLDGRQPARGRDRHRRRRGPPRRPRRARRPVLGDPRRRRQPRRRHLVHVPAARGRPDRLRRADRLAVRARRRDPARPTARSRPRRRASWRCG